MKASFFKRLAAYFLDVMIISFIAGIISAGFTSTKYEEASQEYENLMNSYVAGEITTEEYTNQIGPITYDLQKSSVSVSIITVILSIAYFIVFQYLNKGQTLGKKLLKIRVEENGNTPSLKSIIIRTIVIDSILSSILGIVFLYVVSKNNYYTSYNIVTSIEMIFAFASALFILYRKDKKGLHDILAHTEVIDERGK